MKLYNKLSPLFFCALLAVSHVACAEGEAMPEAESVSPMAGIAVNSLDKLSSGAVGVIDHNSGGFGANMWEGLTPKDLLQAIGKLPGITTSATSRALQERLLLSMANMPANLAPQQGAMILHARLDKLMQMEDYQNMKKLLEVVPAPEQDETWHKYKLSQYFLSGDFETGCKHVMGAIAKFSNQYWQEKLLFCLGYEREFEKAATTVELMAEKSLSAPDWLRSMLLVWAGKEPLPKVENILRALPPIDAAMLGAGEENIAAVDMASSIKHNYLLIGSMPAIDDVAKQQALENAIKYNHGGLEELRASYLTAEGALATAEAKQYFELHQEAAIEANANKLAEIWRNYDKRGMALVAAKLYEKDFVEMSRAILRKELLPDFATPVFTALFVQGKIGDAGGWLDYANIHNRSAWNVLLALFAPLEDRPKRDDIAELVKNFDANIDNDVTVRTKAVLQGFALLPADTEPQTDAALLKLQKAVAAGRVGEAVAMCINHVGVDAGAMQVKAIAPVLSALRSLGLNKEALLLAHDIIAGALLDSADE